ncbi:hypothetical protein KDA06_05345 [Candidatus Saccharibacteria bacterium]|nr:hypothetical protein [Candidatus Saccharibacteria bacterium]
MSKNNYEVVIISESIVGSIVKDLVTFLMFAGLLYFNHKVLSGNGWIDFLFIGMVFLALLGRNSGRVFSGKRVDAIKWLQSNGKDLR